MFCLHSLLKYVEVLDMLHRLKTGLNLVMNQSNFLGETLCRME